MMRTIGFLSLVLFLSQMAWSQNRLVIPDTLSGSSINLNLQKGQVMFYDGQMTNTMGINGAILGPTLLLNKHQQVAFNLQNNLGEPTTIHWHGMHVAPENDGGPHVVINPGETWSPAFEVLDHAATMWYHPHLHHKTFDHVQMGMAGFIFVRDEQEAALNLPRTYGVDDIPLAIQTKALDNYQIVTTHSALDTSLFVNGTVNPFMDVPAQVVRLRILNGAAERVFNFGFSGNKTFHLIGTDNGLL